MTRFPAIMMVALLMAAPMASAQSPTAADNPSAKLAFYVGHWNESGQSRADPANAFTPLAGFETCEWHDGGQAVVCRETTKEAAGVSHNIYILDWDSAASRYNVHGVDNHGAVIVGTGELHDGRWTWLSNFNVQGASVPLRFIFVPAADGARDMTIETADGKGGWVKMSKVHYAPLE